MKSYIQKIKKIKLTKTQYQHIESTFLSLCDKNKWFDEVRWFDENTINLLATTDFEKFDKTRKQLERKIEKLLPENVIKDFSTTELRELSLFDTYEDYQFYIACDIIDKKISEIASDILEYGWTKEQYIDMLNVQHIDIERYRKI